MIPFLDLFDKPVIPFFLTKTVSLKKSVAAARGIFVSPKIPPPF
jgi:hypothetical protein